MICSVLLGMNMCKISGAVYKNDLTKKKIGVIISIKALPSDGCALVNSYNKEATSTEVTPKS